MWSSNDDDDDDDALAAKLCSQKSFLTQKELPAFPLVVSRSFIQKKVKLLDDFTCFTAARSIHFAESVCGNEFLTTL